MPNTMETTMADDNKAFEAGSVMDYQTGRQLDGEASETLAERSAEAGDTGAVAAYLDDDGVWQYVREDEVESMRRRGRDVRTVWVQP